VANWRQRRRCIDGLNHNGPRSLSRFQNFRCPRLKQRLALIGSCLYY
jgi:hypothetical protein